MKKYYLFYFKELVLIDKWIMFKKCDYIGRK